MKLALVVAWLAAAPAPPAPPAGSAKPGPGEKCPVCGMFVARYPDWIAGIRFGDGTRVLFDGAKDLYKLLLKLEDYGAVARRSDAVSVFVTDYYSLAEVDAREAWYVVGSDVLGPMGHELVPFARRQDAEEFMRDHRGKRILRHGDVNAALLRGLDADG